MFTSDSPPLRMNALIDGCLQRQANILGGRFISLQTGFHIRMRVADTREESFQDLDTVPLFGVGQSRPNLGADDNNSTLKRVGGPPEGAHRIQPNPDG